MTVIQENAEYQGIRVTFTACFSHLSARIFQLFAVSVWPLLPKGRLEELQVMNNLSIRMSMYVAILKRVNIPEWIRTTNLRLRRPTLYPVELRGPLTQRLLSA